MKSRLSLFYNFIGISNKICIRYNMDYTLYTAHNNKLDFYVVRASLNLSARVAQSSIYFVSTNVRPQYLDLNAQLYRYLYYSSQIFLAPL